MGKKAKKSYYNSESPGEDSKDLIGIEQAIRMYKKINKKSELYDPKALEVFTKNRLGSNTATKEEFFEVFKRY